MSITKSPQPRMVVDGFHRRAFVKLAGAALAPFVATGFARAGEERTKTNFDPAGIQAIVFDTVGTLVDSYGTLVRKGGEFTKARGIRVDWNELFNRWRDEWRRQLDQVIAGSTAWRSNDAIYRDALDRILASYEWREKLSTDDRNQLNELWYELEPWPDTKPGLERLAKRFTLSTLSNGSMAQVVRLSKKAGLRFDCILTAELVQSAKPDPKVYALATRSLNLRPDQILMVAAHKYDLAAAKKFGFSVAFIPRPLEIGPSGNVDLKSEDYFDLMQPDLVQVARALGT